MVAAAPNIPKEQRGLQTESTFKTQVKQYGFQKGSPHFSL